jgi:dihydrofolate synthase/folylpolyglutamate synthase
MTYAEAIQFLYGLQMFGANFGLANTFKLAALAGNPQEKLGFIHVAGTNGKGSTCAMLESIYRAAGLRVGLFTSPHLVSFRERIQVNRQLIPEADLVRLVAEIQPLLQQFPAENHLTLFEVVTVMALKFFAEQKCDLVIWETGLGGRLDATNIVTPLASVITNIGLDHTQWLGDTLEKIAAEKAGIIKPGVPVVTAAAQPEVLVVIEQVARQNHSSVEIVNPERLAGTLAPPMLGEHQMLNAALALATVEVLQKEIPVSVENIRAGLVSVNWSGRLQLIQKPNGQKILLDGAHNLAGAEALRSTLERDFSGDRPLFIFGALGDKNWSGICRRLAPLADKIIAVPVASERTANANELAEVFRAANPEATVVVTANLSDALNASKDKPFVVITGSLYLIGEALELLGLSPDTGEERGLNDWTTAKK